MEAWDHELADAGEPLTVFRARYLNELQSHLSPVAEALLPSMGTTSIEFLPGWRRHDLSLADALLLARDRDRSLGYTSVGPHRADWRVDYTGNPDRTTLSRGQAKLTALSLLLAQAEDFASRRGEWPVIVLDDLASELDRNHQRRVLERLLASGAQVLVTGTEVPPALHAIHAPTTLFHVEQGLLTRA